MGLGRSARQQSGTFPDTVTVTSEQVANLDTVERLHQLERRGAYFEAADLAARLLKDFSIEEMRILETVARGEGGRSQEEAEQAERDLQELHAVSFLHVLVVARTGAIENAGELYERYRIGERPDQDSQSLKARLIKDRAFEADGEARAALLREAADAYAEVYDTFGGSFPAVNAATLHLLGGEEDEAVDYARKTLAACEKENPETERQKYYHAASVAEAYLAMGEKEEAEEALVRAGSFKGVHFGARATTIKQLKLLCAARGIDASLLRPISVPDVLYYAGHIIAAPGETGRFPADREDQVKAEIDSYLEAHRPSVAYGSLAAGADILFAEACIEKGIELHLILPFNLTDFIEQSVMPSGGDWVHRFNACLDYFEQGAGGIQRVVTYATDGKFLYDESLFMYGAELAMGLALLRASVLGTGMRMAVVYDGKGGTGVGTDGSLKMWEDLNLPYHVIDCPGGTGPSHHAGADPVRDEERRTRYPRAILFGDVVGFSKLQEEDVPRFHDIFMARISRELKSFGEKVLYKNSWGDALYVVFSDAVDAARFSLSIQKIIADMEFKPAGYEHALQLRLGGHFGPIYQGIDQLCEVETYYGSHVTRAARIEPVTPAGKVYVTESMAASLALSGVDDIDCDYVGPVPLAKDYGEIRMYQLRERS